MILKKRHLNILAHYIKYPDRVLESDLFFIIPPFSNGARTHFSLIDEDDVKAFAYACADAMHAKRNKISQCML